MGIDEITNQDFKDFFTRGFSYSGEKTCNPLEVSDKDLDNAKIEAGYSFNEGLFGSQEELTTPFLYCWAHYLVSDIRAGNQGLGASPNFPVSSKSVDAVSTSYSVPAWATEDTVASFFTTTYYGMKYLTLIRPYITGVVKIAYGASTPR